MPELKPLLKIEGPPGSGKTRMLAREACRLVAEEGLASEQVLLLAITPLNKRRLQAYLRTETAQAGLPQVSFAVLTWEEWLLKILNAFQPEDLQHIHLVPDADARLLLQEVLRQVIQPGHALYHASRQASFGGVFYELVRQLQIQGVTALQLDSLAASVSSEDSRLPLVAEVFRVFMERLHAANLLCHPELCQQAGERLKEHPDLVINRYRAILVDEAQELSPVQHTMLAALPCQLILAGHDQLSIRSFRGASPGSFQNLSDYTQHAITFWPQQACLRNNEAILTLLNEFLPSPIWQEHQIDRDQLNEMVHFGLFQEPDEEANGIVRWIEQFVATAQVEDRHARWDDCVILLRSGHYQPQLVHALLRQGIPFRSEVLSESLIRFQHVYYDLLQVFYGLEQLAVTPMLLENPSALDAHLARLTLGSVHKQSLYQEGNRHLLRWLDAMLSAQENGANLLAGLQAELPEGAVWLLPRLLDGQALPSGLYEAGQALVELYRTYQEARCQVALLDGLIPIFSSADGDAADDLQAGLEACRRNLERLNRHYQSTFGQALPLAEILAGFSSLWDGQDAISVVDPERGAVRLLSIHQVQGETFPLVAIPFLVSGEFPHTRDMPEVVSDADRQALGVPLAYRIDEAEEARLLATGMSRASHQLLMSTHTLEAGVPVLPSAFYQRLLSRKRELLEKSAAAMLCLSANLVTDECDLAFCCYHPASERIKASQAVGSDDPFSRYSGESAWAALEKQAKTPLFGTDETVYLNASSIKTYMTCPRQFYYKHLLRLPQPGSEAASLGSLIHGVMEVFNTQATTKPYTAERLKVLAETMFLFQTDLEAFYAIGFQESDLHELRRLSPLALTTLHQRLMESIDDLERKGYFARYGSLRQVQPEKQLEGFQLNGIERCRFSGTIDALIQREDGLWDILDYKTFRSAYGVGVDTCDKRFRETLDPLPGDDSLTHAERFASKLSPAYPKDYQLPLYYLACAQDAAYKGRLSSVALQIVRPGFPENPAQGAIRLELSAEDIEANKQQMVEDIRRYIVDPIMDSAVFETNPSRMTCGSCGYYGICTVGSDADEGGEA